MSLGWGLRGSIGGGPLGALIPGALVALTIAALHNIPARNAMRAAAFAAVGVSFGGEMTYGQTIGLAKQADTMWFGLLGLAIKGGVWGLIAAPIVWLGFNHPRISPRALALPTTLFLAGTALGWRFVNHPKLIYFSDPVNKPREEVWFGLLLGGILLAAALCRELKSNLPARHAAIGLLGGAAGFGGGGLVMLAFIHSGSDALNVDSWKAMEFFFGFLFGLTLAWLNPTVSPSPAQPKPFPIWLLTSALIILAVFLVESRDPLRFTWACIGSAFLLLLAWRQDIDSEIALVLTVFAAVWDLEEFSLWARLPFLLYLPWARQWGLPGLAIVTTLIAWCKFSSRGIPHFGAAHVLAVFSLMTITLLWGLRRKISQ
jgi:hypothetical protein